MLKYKEYRIGRFRTSEIELMDLFKAWIAISVAFAIAFGGIGPSLMTFRFIILFLSAAFTVGIGFLIHELLHKIVAQRYGCFAEFRADNTMLVFALVFSLFGFVIAAPGAVVIAGGRIDEKKNGLISMAGPLTNIVLALIFFLLAILSPTQLFQLGFKINSWIALFNLIPIGFFDGAKIFNWSKFVWGIMAIGAFFMVFFI